MTVPQEIALAGQRFDAMLVDLMDRLNLGTRHQTYAVLYGFLRVFRQRLDSDQVLVFAGALPVIVGAMFVREWDPDAERLPFADSDAYDAELRAIRRHHNLAPPGARRIIAACLRAHMDAAAFEAALARLPGEARAFWE
ncbi:DUF2267 domain-containing protein [Hoeflea olei]|uniref:DUF2267 domain-containing protein n=1 Tax=Hoeflea olei TaxID=1480615 RepID=A0A1C1YZH1_9HYPH|nr:DUF2267 domain-containing protein [Hoeflea olei]OCW58806.1 hypothetical protein AWJ14_20680 [Hoeflea olei]